MSVVSNTTPINYLVQIGHAETLRALFGRVFVPSVVVAELSDAGAPEVVRTWITNPPEWISVEEVIVPHDDALGALEPGERAAIVLAEQRSLLLVIDELEGRRVAKVRGLLVTGTLGVLDRAAARGLLDFTDAIARLQRTTFHVSSKLLKPLLERDRTRKSRGT